MNNIDPHLPINSTAAIVVSKCNDPNVVCNPGDRITSMSPLPTKRWHGKKEHDLTGIKSGRFIVIGCALWMPKNWKTQEGSQRTRWVVKCTCGRFQMFTSKAIKKNINNERFACYECEKIMSLKFRASRDYINQKLKEQDNGK